MLINILYFSYFEKKRSNGQYSKWSNVISVQTEIRWWNPIWNVVQKKKKERKKRKEKKRKEKKRKEKKKKRKEKEKKTRKTKQNNSTIIKLSLCNFHFSHQQAETSGFSMVPGAISVFYFCLKKERKEYSSQKFHFQRLLQQIHPYPHLHLGGGADVNTLLMCTHTKKVLLHYSWVAYVSFSLEICKYWLCKSITFLHLSSVQPTHFSNCRQFDVCSKIQNDSGTFLKHIRPHGIPVHLLLSWTDIQLAFLVHQWHFCYLLR